MSLIDKYFDAWERQDAALLDEVFSNDASYIISQKCRNIKGIDQIKAYWERNSNRQRNLSIIRKSITFLDYSLSYFEAHFLDVFEGIQCVRGLILTISSDNIHTLIEVYCKR